MWINCILKVLASESTRCMSHHCKLRIEDNLLEDNLCLGCAVPHVQSGELNPAMLGTRCWTHLSTNCRTLLSTALVAGAWAWMVWCKHVWVLVYLQYIYQPNRFAFPLYNYTWFFLSLKDHTTRNITEPAYGFEDTNFPMFIFLHHVRLKMTGACGLVSISALPVPSGDEGLRGNLFTSI